VIYSPWFLVGFVLGGIAGTLVTDLRREEIRPENFWPGWSLLRSRQQSLTFVAALWVVLLFWAIPSSGGADLLIGSVIGAAAAPWVWHHFVRNFGADAKLTEEKKDTRIKAGAEEIWRNEGQPEGRREEHWRAAEKEVEDAEQQRIETLAEQQLARYRLLSILLGIALLVVTLLPVLKEWLPRAQQFSAFGVSLTLLERQAGNQDRGTPLIQVPTDEESGGDRLLEATYAAYRIGAANRKALLTSLQNIGATLDNFGDLSIIDTDRAFISWVVFEEPGRGDDLRRIENATNPTLIKYVEEAENLLHNSRDPERWVDSEVDWAFVADSTVISKCFYNKAKRVHDPHFFVMEVGPFLNRLVQEVYAGKVTQQFYDVASPNISDGCNVDFSLLSTLSDLYHSTVNTQLSAHSQFEVSPYPTLVTANYLAAIGAVDTGVLMIEDWIKHFKRTHEDRALDYGPQLEWYLERAQLGAGNLPYQFGGLTVPHRGLVGWYVGETSRLRKLINVAGPEDWNRLCSSKLPPTLHRNIGHWLAFLYATERFYLFENLTKQDFDPNDKGDLGSLSDNIREAEMLRNNHYCLEAVPYYRKDREKYNAYFNLYTAQLHLILLSTVDSIDRRNSLVETIGKELDEANYLGPPAKTSSLLPVGDTWQRHRDRLKLLKAQLDAEKSRS
jgi:hypothetical protein